MELTPHDEFEVKLIFKNGELFDVEPLGQDYEKGKILPQEKGLMGLNIMSSTSLLLGHGSPGYTIYRTTRGYVIIRKPQ